MKSYKEELQEFVEIYNYIDEMENTLLYHSDIDRDEAYKKLYDKAFSEEVNRRLQKIYSFDWYDPDMDYSDDYSAWKSELDSVVKKVKKMLDD